MRVFAISGLQVLLLFYFIYLRIFFITRDFRQPKTHLQITEKKPTFYHISENFQNLFDIYFITIVIINTGTLLTVSKLRCIKQGGTLVTQL